MYYKFSLDNIARLQKENLNNYRGLKTYFLQVFCQGQSKSLSDSMSVVEG